jgi:predicted metal-dependent phosphoesterase TrpH
MTPPAIVAAALEKGLAMIAVCDHNSAGNAAAVQAAAAGRALAVLAGIEITTAEEVHVLGLFPGPLAARAVSDEVRATLPEATPASARFGLGRLMDAAGREVGREEKLLSAASALDLNAAVKLIHRRHGLAIAAHVDRPAFGVLGQLGLFPQGAGFDGIELSAAGAMRLARGQAASQIPDFRFQIPGGLPVVCGSDAHSLGELGAGRTLLDLREPTFGELALALRGLGGRGCACA